ncbi:MAG: hypothetical protein HZB40_04455 [Rhodocyclales bacterium]|nr:hypothetical protein [Rhodocyclales bacterium]
MKLRVMLIVVALLPSAASARTAAGDCANARDPGRCEAQRAALKTCADKRGAEKRACLDAALPPVDCAKAANPQRCEATQKAREVCRGKSGKALKACLRDEAPKKPRHKRKPPAPQKS